MEILPHCAAVPLGVMVRGIMESLLDAEALGKLLQEYAPQQSTLELAIDTLVSLLIQVSAGHRASVFSAYTADQATLFVKRTTKLDFCPFCSTQNPHFFRVFANGSPTFCKL